MHFTWAVRREFDSCSLLPVPGFDSESSEWWRKGEWTEHFRKMIFFKDPSFQLSRKEGALRFEQSPASFCWDTEPLIYKQTHLQRLSNKSKLLFWLNSAPLDCIDGDSPKTSKCSLTFHSEHTVTPQTFPWSYSGGHAAIQTPTRIIFWRMVFELWWCCL